jgi:hypothetical protein
VNAKCLSCGGTGKKMDEYTFAPCGECDACLGDGYYDVGPATLGEWEYSERGPGGTLVIHGPFDGDADDEGRSIDCTDYVAELCDTPRAEANAAHIVRCVNRNLKYLRLLLETRGHLDAIVLALHNGRGDVAAGIAFEVSGSIRRAVEEFCAPEARAGGQPTAGGELTVTEREDLK